jgi:hypothetical protein
VNRFWTVTQQTQTQTHTHSFFSPSTHSFIPNTFACSYSLALALPYSLRYYNEPSFDLSLTLLCEDLPVLLSCEPSVRRCLHGHHLNKANQPMRRMDQCPLVVPSIHNATSLEIIPRYPCPDDPYASQTMWKALQVHARRPTEQKGKWPVAAARTPRDVG